MRVSNEVVRAARRMPEDGIDTDRWIPFRVHTLRAIEKAATLFQGSSEEQAEKDAEERWALDDAEQNIRQAARTVEEYQRYMSRFATLNMNRDALARVLGLSSEELRQTFSSHPDDPARKRLLDYIPVTEEQLREILERR